MSVVVIMLSYILVASRGCHDAKTSTCIHALLDIFFFQRVLLNDDKCCSGHRQQLDRLGNRREAGSGAGPARVARRSPGRPDRERRPTPNGEFPNSTATHIFIYLFAHLLGKRFSRSSMNTWVIPLPSKAHPAFTRAWSSAGMSALRRLVLLSLWFESTKPSSLSRSFSRPRVA